MFTPELIATVFYGILTLAGGVIGYLKSQSKISLISGGVSGLVLLILAAMINLGLSWATPIAATIILLLIVVFIIRWFKTKKLIPALPMIFFGVVSLVFILS
ncbi:MAG: TMEM14 family protein [Xenococcaceae cyanobacterium MO_207.B15]|nr:TMEM14 family protein [Xenococcaceae cyanobacterium MO_207.B15]MDJ0744813.1 TMEM14 family protein [Xenococcaceae cyanobacterium MO_167.B27]